MSKILLEWMFLSWKHYSNLKRVDNSMLRVRRCFFTLISFTNMLMKIENYPQVSEIKINKLPVNMIWDLIIYIKVINKKLISCKINLKILTDKHMIIESPGNRFFFLL